MKQIRTIFLFLFLACIMPVVTSCGGSDSEEVEYVPAEIETWDDWNFKEGCEIFGLNKDDYKPINSVLDPNRITLRLYTFIKKSDNSLFVGLYDLSTKQVILKDEQLKINPTETFQYYDQKYIVDIHESSYKYINTGTEYAICLKLRYISNDEKYGATIPVLYLNDGSKTFSNKLPIASHCELYKWYKNSVLFEDDKNVTCYTYDGIEKFSRKIPSAAEAPEMGLTGYTFNLSYTDYISIVYWGGKNDNFWAQRTNFENGETVWKTGFTCLDNTNSDTKFSFDVEEGTPEYKITIKAVDIDGTTNSAVVIVNIETGEVKVQ